ncbi:predicted protein [Nematostella vectensis]|uniref:PDZ domain-containing protein 8 n=1 Tax=Nematostella vectensis TaxID=45351 RepID=A7SEI6_NEMVE|nr:predicted protein [Nematostella vectensis]|eukprot:XP_001629948.1 predicted protein [Nematostella vectensis]
MIIAFTFAFLTGAFSVLLVQAFLLYKWWSSKEREAPKLIVQHEKVANPKLVAECKKNGGPNELSFLNLLILFIWEEWRDTEAAKNFCLRRLNMELSDLMRNKTAGRVIEQITIQDISLGSSLPVIKGASVVNIETKGPNGNPHELDIALDLEYSGGCHVAIQVDLLFNKSAYFSVKMVYLKGQGRIRFQQSPCTHWSFSFYEEPELEFEAESHFEGKTIPQLTSLIVNHLRRSVYKKHTLPSYKIRYAPFFRPNKPQDEQQEIHLHNSLLTVGKLAVEVVGCSRLPEFEGGLSLYCSLSVDVLPWKQLAENSRALWTSYEVEVTRETSSISYGMTLIKEYGNTEMDKFIMVDVITPKSPADLAGLHKGDVLIAVDGQKIESLKQAAKLIKNKAKFSATIQRPPSKMPPKDKIDGTSVKCNIVASENGNSNPNEDFVDIIMDELIKHSDINTGRELRQRTGKGSTKQRSSTLSTISPIETKETSKNVTEATRPIRSSTVATDGKPEVSKAPERSRSISPESKPSTPKLSETGVSKDDAVPMSFLIRPSTYSERPGTRKTREVPSSLEPAWNETIIFDVEKKDKYLNVCVWSKSQDKLDLLLGYIISPPHMLLCIVSKTHFLVSPHIDGIIANRPQLRAHPGLKEELCGGDIKLIFRHSPSLIGSEEMIIDKQQELLQIASQLEANRDDTSESMEQRVEHHFVLTEFYFPTRCNYCSKKVWTKVAFLCRNCALICHKKCLDNCKRFSSCLRSSKEKSRWFSKKPPLSSESEETKPEVSLPEMSSPNEPEAPGTDQASSSNVDQSETCEKERDGDQGAEEAKVVYKDEGATVKSEPKSPTRKSKLKLSLTEKIKKGASEDEVRLSDMEVASMQVREVGRELFSNLPFEARKKKLQEMMARLQVEIDEENETRTELYKNKKTSKDRKQKNYMDTLITKSEERSQALAMLMLQYCAGMQSCADAEEEESCQL